MKDFSYITSSSPAFIDSLYQDYLKNPDNVDIELKKFFEGFDFAVSSHSANGNGTLTAAKPAATQASTDIDWMREIRVYRLILGYRNKGHLIAKTNPIRARKDRGANLELSFFGLGEEDMDKVYNAGNLIGLGPTTLRKILTHLQNCYADHVGIEFKYISEQKRIDWLTNEMERKFTDPLPIEKKRA
jgi:2-oxoglutarate dehydrogenase E1 component